MATSKARIHQLIEEATIDCYGEDEQHTGLLTMIEDNVECPFTAKIIGAQVTVVELAWPKSGYGLMAGCELNGKQHRVDITSLEFVKPRPVGFEWIEAYLAWRGGVDSEVYDEKEDE